jgi:hypothetical protein
MKKGHLRGHCTPCFTSTGIRLYVPLTSATILLFLSLRKVISPLNLERIPLNQHCLVASMGPIL